MVSSEIEIPGLLCLNNKLLFLLPVLQKETGEIPVGSCRRDSFPEGADPELGFGGWQVRGGTQAVLQQRTLQGTREMGLAEGFCKALRTLARSEGQAVPWVCSVKPATISYHPV